MATTPGANNSLIASGTEGTCQWELYTNGQLYIGDGTISHNTDSYNWGWYQYRTEITSVLSGNVYWAPGANAYGMFYGCSNLVSVNLSKFYTSNVTTMSHMFYYCRSLTSLEFPPAFDTRNVTSMSYMFHTCEKLAYISGLSVFDTSNVTNMNRMFYGCKALTTLDLSRFDTSKVENMEYMFYDCRKLLSLDLLSFDTSNVTNMGFMFDSCENLKSLDLSNFDTSNVTYMSYMFYNCRTLTSLNLLSQFDTSNVTSMSSMFSNCTSLNSLDLSNFNTSKVTNMNSMFAFCNITSLNISQFDTSKVTNMGSMFRNCTSLTLLDISNFNMSSVTNINSMFYNCYSLRNLYTTKLFLDSVTNIAYSFCNCRNLLSLNLIISNETLNSTYSAFNSTVNNFYIVDPTQSNTSWKNVALSYDNVFYNVEEISLPLYKLKASRGVIENNEWKDDDGGDSIRFICDVGDSSVITGFSDEIEYTDTTYSVKENNVEIQGQWQQEGNVYTLILSPSDFDEEKSHQYLMEISYNFTGDDYDPETEGSITYSRKVSQIVSIPQAYALLDFRAGGKGIAIGKFSERNGFDIAFPVSIGEGLQPPETQEFFLSKDTTVDNSKTYYIEQNNEYVVVSNPTGSPVENSYYESRMTVDLRNYQFLIGEYNEPISDAYMVIGGGSDNEHRRNVLELDTGGLRIYAADGWTQLANIGYGRSQGESGTYSDYPYYTFGVRDSSTIGAYSVSEGYETMAAGPYSHAEGMGGSDFLSAYGMASHAEGKQNFAEGDYSHAEGAYNRAGGMASHVSGRFVRAMEDDQFCIGVWNDNQPNTAFEIGNGSDPISGGNYSNAFTVDWNGNVMAQGMAGMIIMFGGSTAPAGWLLCDGSVVSRTTYAKLFAIIGTTYGAGNGSTTFNLPDLRGRFPLGVSSSYPITGTDSSGGAATVTLQASQIPGHTHGPGTLNIKSSGSHAHKLTYSQDAASGTAKNRVIPGDDTGTVGANDATKTASHTHSSSDFAGATAQNTGGGGAHNNMPPYRTVNFIIATGKTS